MRQTLTRIVCFVLMIVGFVAYIAKAPAFPIASANLLPWSVWFILLAVANVVLWQRVMKVLSFSLLVIWFYAFAASVVPETSTAQLDLSSIERTPEAFIEAGEAIFTGKGKCLTCHTLDPSAPKGRCPDLQGVGTRAATRQPGVSAKEYLIESLYDPYAFLVPGYDKIMPPVWKAPISLSELEIETVIAFLQSQGGEVDLTPFEPPVDLSNVAATAEALPPILTGDPDLGKNVFVNVAKCIACHNVAGVEKPAGQQLDEGVEVVTAPDLTEIAALNEARYIEESVLKPNAKIVVGYGSTSIRTGGGTVDGILAEQDNEKIVVTVKGDGDQEENRTIALSDIDPEPISELVDLKAKGYFWVSVTPVDTGIPIEGGLVDEDNENMTLQVGGETQTVSKSNVKVQLSITTFDDDEPIVGELTSEAKVEELLDLDEIVIRVDGAEKTIDPFDVDTITASRGFGKRIPVRSLMPDNFPQLLTVSQFSDLLAFLFTLTGVTGDATSDTTAAASTGAAEEEPAE